VGAGDLLQTWSLTVLRGALIAAAIAGLLLLRDGPVTTLGAEEALTMELEDRTLPDLMGQSEGDDPFLLIEVTF
jgi:DNA-binding FadR family transcriptional regulator